MATKKKRAVSAGKLKNELIQIRIPADQKRALIDVAARDGLDLSSWARRVLLREAGILPPAKG